MGRNAMAEEIRDPLPGLRKQLEHECGDVASSEAIARAAEDALTELEGARIREFVPLFAWRRARARLRKAS
jgi:hypothetical protein